MIRKCEGCGSILQCTNKYKDGYVKENMLDKASLCERCFKIKHYGKNDIIDITFDYEKMIYDIRDEKKIFLVDVLNISNNINYYLKYLNESDIVLLTKRDLLPKSVKDKKLINYFKDNYNFKGEVNIISSKKKYNIDNILNSLTKGNYYVLGLTNSGKSTFINTLIESKGNKSNITVSANPNTTTEYIKLKLNDDVTIIDTPGFVNENSIYKFLTPSEIKKISPKKEIKPLIMQTKSGFTCIVDKYLRIDNIGDKTNLIFYMSNSLDIKKMRIETRDELKCFPKKIYELNGEEDIVIEGIGFIKVSKPSKLAIYSVSDSLISIRKKMI